MKIKKTRQVRLDELISWAWNNDVKSKRFRSDKCNEVYFDRDKWITFDCACVTQDERFTITEEVEITEDMVFPIVFVYWSDIYEEWRTADRQKTPIKDLKIIHDVKFIYLQNDDGSIGELIWSKERGLID